MQSFRLMNRAFVLIFIFGLSSFPTFAEWAYTPQPLRCAISLTSTAERKLDLELKQYLKVPFTDGSVRWDYVKSFFRPTNLKFEGALLYPGEVELVDIATDGFEVWHNSIRVHNNYELIRNGDHDFILRAKNRPVAAPSMTQIQTVLVKENGKLVLRVRDLAGQVIRQTNPNLTTQLEVDMRQVRNGWFDKKMGRVIVDLEGPEQSFDLEEIFKRAGKNLHLQVGKSYYLYGGLRRVNTKEFSADWSADRYLSEPLVF